MAEQIVGIDLGTTYSLVAAVRDGRPVVLDYRGEKLLPSVVGLASSGELLVGTPARNQLVVAPERTIKSIKRSMGSPESVTLGTQRYTPPEISAFILRELKRRAEAVLGEPVQRAVITVPARFSDVQRQATRDAGEIAGFDVARIINEPTAAALAYGLQRSGSRRALVYDLGGGTFDVSAVELTDGIVEVRASHGNPHLGGDDFDALLAERLAETVERERRRRPQEDRRAAARLAQAAERAKITLSDAPYAAVREEHLLRGVHLETRVAREDFEALIRDLLNETLAAVDRALQDAGWRPKDVDEVLLVGGSTRIPLVKRLVSQRLGVTPRAEVHPDEAVALGAAIQGAIIAGEPIEAVLVDVCPYSLGIRTAAWSELLGTLDARRFSIVIPRNTTIPCSKTEKFYTLFPEQDSVQIEVFQGESRRVDENTSLGEFLFKGLTPDPAGGPREVLVSFDYDVDGIVRVTAHDPRGGKQKGIKITAPVKHLSTDQKEQARAAIEAAPPPESDVAAALIMRSRAVRERLEQAGAMTELAALNALLAAVEQAPPGDDHDAAVDRLAEWIYEHEDEDEDEAEGE